MEERSIDRVEPKEIAVLTVLKKGTILKTIFLNSPPSPEQQHRDNEKFIVGRHTDCHIVLDHPSISRFHLEVLVQASSRKLIITDLSSVHGTWVSGRRVEPRVAVELREGETLKLGASTRVYVVRWVPVDGVFEWDSLLETVSEEKEETLQEEDSLDSMLQIAIPSKATVLESVVSQPFDHRSDSDSGSDEMNSPLYEVEELKQMENQAGLDLDRENLSPVKPERRLEASSLLSRRKKSISHLQLQTNEKSKRGKEGESSSALVKELVPKVLFPDDCGDEEEVHFSDKENITPIVCSKHKIKKSMNTQKTLCLNEGEIENENKMQDLSGDGEIENCTGKLGGLLSSFDSGDFCDSDRENRNPVAKSEKPHGSWNIKERGEEEHQMFGSDKENQTPNVSGISKGKNRSSFDMCRRINRAISKKREERVPFQSLLENLTCDSPSSNFGSPSGAVGVLEKEESVSENSPMISSASNVKKRLERVPFQSLLDNSNTKSRSPLSHGSGCAKTKRSISEKMKAEREIESERSTERIPFKTLMYDMGRAISANDHGHEKHEAFGREKESMKLDKEGDADQMVADNLASESKSLTIDIDPWKTCSFVERMMGRKIKWNIVVDIGCLIDDESRRSLQLMEGIRGTQLIIPRMVIRELDYLKRCDSLFRRATKVTSALQWIEECMLNTDWWIHVQNLEEIVPVAPTPPATPRMDPKDGSEESGCVSNFAVQSAWGRLAEIVSPTAEDHILDCALLFKRLKGDKQIVLLTNSTTLKIKAMAEGMLCESPKDFRTSLVNPYSERFLWVESSPRGPTWSISDETEKIENLYHHNPTMRRPTKAAETARGLKLILLHNSHYGQISV